MNQEEFVRKVYPFYNMTLRVATIIVKDYDEAKNIAQDVFESLWMERCKLGDEKQIYSFVYVSAYNRSIDFLRAAGRTSRFLEQFAFAQPQTTDEPFEPSDEFLRLQAVVSELPPAIAIVFQLRGLEEYEFEEIAEMIGKDEANIRVGISRARNMIKEKINKIR